MEERIVVMKRWNSLVITIKYRWTTRILPIWRPFKSLMLSIIGVLLICLLFKYVFLSNCLSIKGTSACVSSIVTDTTVLLTIGSLLIALFVMIPTFWLESKIKDAKIEVTEALRASIHNDMQKINEAQIILLEVNRFYKMPDSFTDAERLVKKVVEIWPDFRQKEFMRLGIEMGKAVIHGYFPVVPGDVIDPANMLREDEIVWLKINAINYLRETVLIGDSPDKDGLLYLACIFGYQKDYHEMIKVIDIANYNNVDIKEDFREAFKLSALLRACGSDRNKLVKLGRKIELALPAMRDAFCNSLRNIDLTGINNYIPWIAVKKPNNPSEGEIFMIKIYAQDGIDGRRKVNAVYHKRGDDTRSEAIATAVNRISIEELFDGLNPLFYLIYLEE